MTCRISLLVILTLLGGFAVASAQEGPAGAGRFEVNVFPGGGMFFTQGKDDSEPDFFNYPLGASFGYNINRWIGIEGELSAAMGMDQNLNFALGRSRKASPPHMVAYNANLVAHPSGSNRALAPYVTGGIGGLNAVDSDDLDVLFGFKAKGFFASDLGGGLKWWSRRNWGLRGDYRLFIVQGKDDAPVIFGRHGRRFGHRISGGVTYTWNP